MRTRSAVHSVIALITATCFGGAPFVQVLKAAQAQPAPTAAKPAAAKPVPAAAKPAGAPPAPAPAATPGAPDGGWPRAYTTPSGAHLMLYQPQISSWDNKEHMVAYSAVAYETAGAEKPALGTVRIEADTSVSMDKRLVSFANFTVPEMNFSTLKKEQSQDVAAQLQQAIPKHERVISLDRVLASVDKSTIIPKNVEGVKADPPKIFFSNTPAILVGFDGDPIWSPIKGNDLKYVINTNWDVFQDSTSKALYLRDEDHWYTATQIEGPWTPAKKKEMPESFKKLPEDENWKEVKKNFPGDEIDAKKMPKIFVSTKPAEMILLTGKGVPNYMLVEGTKDLLWVENTESDVFRVQKDGPVFFLVSGRWFSAPDFNGPW